MAINNKNLVQDVQTLNQSLETSDTSNIQNTISSSLLGLFNNEPSIVVNDELINQLTTTRNLVGVANRIRTTRAKLSVAQRPQIQINNIPVPSSIVNLINPLTAKKIQDQIDIINNTNTPNLVNLPNQLTTINTRLNDNRTILTEISDIQTQIAAINNPGGTAQQRQTNIATRQTNIAGRQRELNACSSIRGILERIGQLEITLAGTTNANTQNNLNGQIAGLRANLATQLTSQRANLPAGAQNINQNTTTGADIQTLITEETTLTQQLDTLRQELDNFQQLERLDLQLQKEIRKLKQTQIVVPQHIGITQNIINNLIINPNQNPFPAANVLITTIDTAINELGIVDNAQIQLKQRYEDNLKTLNELLPLQKLQEYLTSLHIAPGLSTTRSDEINQIVSIGQQIFRLGQRGFQHEIGSYTLGINGSFVNPTDLNALFVPNGTILNGQNVPVNYSVAGPNGEELTNTVNTIQTSVDGQNVTLSGITIQNGNLNITNLGITPVENIKFPLRLSLNIRARIQDPLTGLLVDHFKPMILTINQPQLTQADRQNAYNTLNNPGNTNTIDTRINIEHTNNNRMREDEVLREMLSAGGKQAEVDALRKDEAQAREFIKRIRAIPGLIPVVSIVQAINPAGFRAAMTDPTRAVPVQHLVSEAAFSDYLTNNLDANIQEYLRRNIRTTLDNPQNRNVIFREFLDFQTELKNNKVDSNIDQDVHTDLVGVEMESKKDRRLFGRKDNNYMRFFSGASVDLGEQNVELNKPVKYTMKLKVSGKNKLLATIKIGDKEEKTYKGNDPMDLMRKLLSEKTIPEGKTRAHIAYNVAKGMIQKAKEEDISLSYRDAATNHNMVITMSGKNIVLEDQDDLTNHGTTNRRITETLFDYSLFESTNSWEDPNRSGRHVLAPDNRTLRIGIERLTKHFNLAMNDVNKYYNCATERKMGGLLRSNTSSDFPTSAWTSPIKKLMNLKTTTNFDFSTSVSHNGKTVQIERKGNTFFLSIDGVELKGKDLGKLLKKRKAGVRLFDGVERAICGEIYKNMIEKLKTNTKIARSNFGVMDPKTGRMYILDEDGQIGYLRAEESSVEADNFKKNPGVNTIVNGAAIGGLTAAGIASGGTAALAAGFSLGAVGTAASWGAIAAPGTALFKDIRRITGTGYGTLKDTPAARIICNEAEIREIYKDPFLMGKFMKIMNLRLGQI